MKNHNMVLAIKAIMKARAMGIIWKLILQIVLDRPSAIVNAWNKIDKRPARCPAKILIHPGNKTESVFQCSECQTFVSCVGTDGRCGGCSPFSYY